LGEKTSISEALRGDVSTLEYRIQHEKKEIDRVDSEVRE
jgi:cell division protein FtsL